MPLRTSGTLVYLISSYWTTWTRLPYGADPVLPEIARRYGISYRQTLAQVIQMNTGTVVQPNVSKTAG